MRTRTTTLLLSALATVVAGWFPLAAVQADTAAGITAPIGAAATATTAHEVLLATRAGQVVAVDAGRATVERPAGGLAHPAVGVAGTPSGEGWWLAAADGGIFTSGDARFLGSTGAMRLNQPIVGMAATPTGNGYWLVAADGGIFTFGDARFNGAALSMVPAAGIGADGAGGYVVLDQLGHVSSFPAAGAPAAVPTSTATPAAPSGATSGDAGTWTAEPRLKADPRVTWMWTMDNPAGARATIGTGFDESFISAQSAPPAPAPDGGEPNGNVLKIRHPVNDPGVAHDKFTGYGGATRRRFSKLGLAPERSLHMRYSLYIPSDFNPYDGGKLFSLFSHPDNRSLWGDQGMSSAGVYSDDSWWAGIMFVGPSLLQGTYPNKTYSGDANLDHIRIQPYVYAKQINGVTMTADSVKNGQRGWNVKLRGGLDQDPGAAATASGTGSGGYLYLQRGAWNTLEQEVVLNDAGAANGVLRMWVNGTLGLNIKNVKWAGDAYNSTATINGLMLDTFFGGPSANATDQVLYYDDVVLSRGYVGPRT